MVLISGSRGYIGSRLSQKLEYEFNHIDTCDLKDGRDILSYEPKEKIDIIYHLAAQAGIPESVEDPINDARQNILGTIKAIQLANKNNARLIFTASAASLDPESPYGLSKKTSEEYIKMLCNDYVILRLSSIYGDKPVGVVDNFIRGNRCTIFGTGYATRDFVHVDDIVEALIMARNWEKGIYDCGSNQATTIILLAMAAGKEIEYAPIRKGEKLNAVLSNTTPNWKPKIDVIEYIKSKTKT